ncbi:MAG: hypothetical protein HZA15_14850 [Nitrospirae bacterium]|nr:hypothetical protein [Nitrospirota bacterium]
MMIQNCWEYMNCGRDGNNGQEACPAKTETRAHRLNRGTNGGRVCWAVEGTRCYGKVQGTYAEKVMICSECEFRRVVQDEEWPSFWLVYMKS